MSAQKIQRCCVCDAPTGRCAEDSIFLPSMDPNGNDLGPLCDDCIEERDPACAQPLPAPPSEGE